MPDGMAGFLRDLPGLRSLSRPAAYAASDGRGVQGELLAKSADARRQRLELNEIKMHFGGVKAIDDLSMTVEPGQVHGLIGPNGSGKSTLVNVVTGVYTPTAGEVRLGSRVLNRLRPHNIAAAGVTRTFQNIQLFKDLSVLDNVMMGFHTRRRAGFLHQLLRTRYAALEEDDVRRGHCGCLRFWRSSTSPMPRRSRCRTGCSAWSKSLGRWPPGRRSCCSTSPPRASTLARSAGYRA